MVTTRRSSGLQRGRGVGETKWHDEELVVAVVGAKCHLVDVPVNMRT
jgi:hypothetical protein